MCENERAPTAENGFLAQTDLELVRAARHGDLDAFHKLVDHYAAYLYGLAQSLVGNAADAEDMVQETFAGAFRGLRAFREQASVKTWLTRILVRQTARHFRRARSPQPALLSGSARMEAVAAATPETDIRIDVQAAILALRPDHREVIVLREIEGFSYEEIAQALEIPRGTVESRLFRARRELHDLLRAYLT